MSRSLKKRVAKLEEHLDQIGGNCEFTIVFNPPQSGKSESEGQVGENQRSPLEQANTLPKKMIYI